MSQRSKMTNYDIVHQHSEDVVLGALFILSCFVREGSDTCNKYAANLIFTGTCYHKGVAFDAAEFITAGVFVADSNYLGLLIERTQTEALVVGVRDYRNITALDAKTVISQPCNFCQWIYLSFIGRRPYLQRGPSAKIPCNCTSLPVFHANVEMCISPTHLPHPLTHSSCTPPISRSAPRLLGRRKTM